MPDGMTGDRRYFGKYRGTVVNALDPLFKGRVMVLITVGGSPVQLWAEACTPYAGPGVGFYAIPPVGAGVWVEFEEGDLERPIWTGCWWRDGEVATMLSPDLPPATPAAATSLVVLRTQTARLKLDTLTGFAVLETMLAPSPAVPTQIKVGPTGVEIKCGINTLRVTPTGITQM